MIHLQRAQNCNVVTHTKGSETRDSKLEDFAWQERCLEREPKDGCHSMSLDVPKSHRCDIAWFVHKLRASNGLDPELQSNAIRFAICVTF